MNKFTIDYILPLFNLLYRFFPHFYLYLYSLYKQIYEKDKVAFISTLLKKGDVVLDIGANVGFYTKIFSKLVGRLGLVYAFEPDEKNFRLLRYNLKKSKNTKLVNVAVGDKNQIIRLYKSNTRNTDHQTYDIGGSRSFNDIKCIKIDNFKIKTKNLSLVKIDVQGYDYFALRGMSSLLKRSKKVVIFGEIWPYGLKKSGSNSFKYLNLIKDLGFKFVDPDFTLSKLNKYQDDKYFYVDFIARKS